jgi:hypothetical protein
MRDFSKYIDDTSKTFFDIFFSDGSVKRVPYKHRWEANYKKSILSKLYQLQAWAKRHKLSCGMISLTCSQSNLTDQEILDNLKKAWNTYRHTFDKMGFQYFLIYEPHESGIPHIHIMLFGDMKEDNINRLRDLWINKYEMGNEHAFDFSVDKKEVENLVNYLMKYMSKTVLTDFEANEGLIRFHSLFWINQKNHNLYNA